MKLHVIRVLALAAMSVLSGQATAHAVEVYVPNYFDGDVSVLDATTLATIVRIPITSLADPGIAVQGRPSAVVFTSNHALAFVSISNSDQVAVIDTSTRTVVNYIDIVPVSYDALIFLSPAGDRLYVTSCLEPIISVIDVSTQQMIDQIELPGGSYAMAFSSTGAVGYVGNGYFPCGIANGIYRIDLATNTLLGFIPTAHTVADVAVHPAGGFALATGGQGISVVDLTTNAGAGAVMCGLAPCVYGSTAGVVFNAAGTRAYALDDTANKLMTINTSTGSQRYLQELSKVPIVLGPDEWVWQLAVRQNRARVVAYGLPGEAVMFDISKDTPVQLMNGGAANWAYELALWLPPAPTSANQCKNDGWKSFGLFNNQGDCVTFVATKGKNQPAAGLQ